MLGEAMSDSSEAVLGEIPVIARLSLGVEHLSLFLTSSRIVVAHVGKRGAGALATFSFFGRLSEGLEDLFKRGKESVRQRRTDTLSPEGILSADKDNFSLGYDEIVSVDVIQGFRTTGITIVTRDDKLNFSTRGNFETVVGLFEQTLGPKLVSRRLPT